MSRAADPDPTARYVLVKAATKLMLAKGYAATSLDEICAQAHLTKGSLFHYFESKEDLGLAVLEQYFSRVFSKLEEARAAHTDPLEKVCNCIDLLIVASQSYPLREGCLLGRFTQELSETHSRFRQRCADYFGRWRAVLQQDLEAACRATDHRHLDPRAFADYLLATLEGALILSRAQADHTVVARTLELAKQHVQHSFRPAAGEAHGHNQKKESWGHSEATSKLNRRRLRALK